MNDIEYGGFWIRVAASFIDTLLMAVILVPVLTAVYGSGYWLGGAFTAGSWDLLINYVLPAVAVVLFWIYRSATPGKMVFHLVIVDANSGGKPSTGQLICRYLGYYVSMIPLFMGFIWVGIDSRKQGWHDKLAGTMVVRKKPNSPVNF